MSIIVATAYMEEAERFDWLIAMNAGKVLAAGTPAELKARTGAATDRGRLHRACCPTSVARRAIASWSFRRAASSTTSR